jgi:hypothetical protein
MNRKQRRAEEARARKAQEREGAIHLAIGMLRHLAGPTATGATLILADGKMLYLSAEMARVEPGKVRQ